MPQFSPADSTRQLQGIIFTILACVLFAAIPSYMYLLAPLNGILLFALRVLTQLFYALVILWIMGGFRDVLSVFRQPHSLKWALLSTVLIAPHWWLFVWAPLNGHTIDVAMGYFILPLTISLIGRLILKEELRPIQWLAITLAIVGVLLELWFRGTFSWIIILICLGYPAYLFLRRKSPLDTRVNFAIENILLTPLSLVLIMLAIYKGESWLPQSDWAPLILLGMGLLCTAPMLLYIAGSTRLPFTVFGMLGYLEPPLLMLVAVFILGETIHPEQTVSYSFFGLAVIATFGDSINQWRRKQI